MPDAGRCVWCRLAGRQTRRYGRQMLTVTRGGRPGIDKRPDPSDIPHPSYPTFSLTLTDPTSIPSHCATVRISATQHLAAWEREAPLLYPGYLPPQHVNREGASRYYTGSL
ncbi:hypothetical protein Pcinc_042795 [Petrolisthes cinctipes]|uniref:Uncharacterized protein n=1 Tax=Petrolisthes cinctipes TaxID=88211 RepID=A0AAE1BHR1_PETCI|nr:hypothetical protein Pcinc_042795 [Petrolisthes cinctipes]